MSVALRNSWKTTPLPDAHAELRIEKSYTAEEFSQMKKGLVPHEMEDKWFIFFEEGTLYFHRSWTGDEIYRMQLAEQSDGSVRVVTCLVNRDNDRYRFSDDAYDVRLVLFLVDALLLGNDAKFPMPEDVSTEQKPIVIHSVIGYGRSSKE